MTEDKIKYVVNTGGCRVIVRPDPNMRGGIAIPARLRVGLCEEGFTEEEISGWGNLREMIGCGALAVLTEEEFSKVGLLL